MKTKNLKIFFCILIIFFLFTLLLFLLNFKNKNPEGDYQVVKIKNNNFYLEKATTPKQKSLGLMYRDSLEINKGMIFIYDAEEPRSFYMKNTLIPLDLIFLDNEKKIIDTKLNFQPCKTDVCPTFTSKPAKYVIEINSGRFNELELRIEDVLEF